MEKRTITAMFDDYKAAANAVSKLKAAGVPESDPLLVAAMELRSPSGVESQQGEVEMEIHAHMEIVDGNDQHVGTVESVEGDRIKMFVKDALDPKELVLNRSQVAGVDANKVRLSQKVSAITTRAFLSPELAEKITERK